MSRPRPFSPEAVPRQTEDELLMLELAFSRGVLTTLDLHEFFGGGSGTAGAVAGAGSLEVAESDAAIRLRRRRGCRLGLLARAREQA